MMDRIFDPLRKKYVALTPEERVRQYFIQWLNKERNYPLSLMASEYQLQYNTRKFRCDIVCFNKQLKPVLAVECKAPHIKLENIVLEQISRYNMVLNVECAVITNGLSTYACIRDAATGKYRLANDIPYYNDDFLV